MSRTFRFAGLAIAAVVNLASTAQADVFVRAPFVRVYTGHGGVQVRAPFVRLSVPRYAAPVPLYVPMQPAPLEQPPILPPPTPLPGSEVPLAERPMTLNEFARTFRGGAGTYERVLLHPCTGQPCVVRFCLPDCPRRVTCDRDEIIFHYGLAKKIRVHFGDSGVSVTSRGL
jgi:hypothetical protein